MPATKKRKVKPTAKAKANMIFRNCGICRKNCKIASICCDNCDTWYHLRCEELELADYEMFLTEENVNYSCKGCFSHEQSDEYTYTSALLRLTEAGEQGLNYLRFCCKREKGLLPTMTQDENNEEKLAVHSEHSTSKLLLKQYKMNENGVPLASLTDGSCLFSSASMALVGDNSLVTELRVRTCIEMSLNSEAYSKIDNYTNILLVSPSYNKSCIDCSKPGGYSSQWTIHALSNITGNNIRVVYPPVNGTGDLAFITLNTTCLPSNETDRTFTVMWTSCSPPDHTITWSANHFVPLIRKPSMYQTYQTTIDLDNTEIMEHSITMKTSSPIRAGTYMHDDYMAENTSDEFSEISDLDNTEQSSIKVPNGRGNNGKFLSTDELVLVLSNDAKNKEMHIPRGIKNNIGYMVDNTNNEQREKQGKSRQYVDDCGAWGRVSLKTHRFVYQNGRLQYIDLQNGLFVKTAKGARVPLEPQPNPTEVLVLKRAYTKLQRLPEYQRRISWVVTSPESPASGNGVAFVEYIGIFPTTKSLHGNNKNGHGDYIRTNAQIVDDIKGMVKTQNCREIYTDLALDDSMEAPRDLKQIQNFKYNEKKRDRPHQQKASNNADDIQTLMSMQHGHPFIKEIVQLSGKPPSVVVYTDEQLLDLKKFCSSESKHIIGVDRTFNLGAAYVTVTVFHNQNLIRKVSNTPAPIMLGPCYLHWDGCFHTYHRFFSHLQCFLDDIPGAQISGKSLVFGSDEEKALTKAIQKCFPDSQQILCTRHIEENFKRHLREVIGEKDPNYNTVLHDVFGVDGLLSSPDDVEFDLKVMELEAKYEYSVPAFQRYFSCSTSSLKNYVWEPAQKDIAPINWKNNSCESMNNILKLSTNWKAVKLPDLIGKLHKIVQLQYRDIRRALHGQGNYALAPWARKLQVTDVVWSSKCAKEKDAIFRKLMNLSKPRDNFVESSDGKLKIPKTPTTARKPNQKKRIRSNKTTTLKFST